MYSANKLSGCSQNAMRILQSTLARNLPAPCSRRCEAAAALQQMHAAAEDLVSLQEELQPEARRAAGSLWLRQVV